MFYFAIMQSKNISLHPQSRAILGLGALILGAIVLAHTETEEGAIVGGLLTLGGLATLTEPEVASTLIETFKPSI